MFTRLFTTTALLAGLLLAAGLAYSQAYKWVDENGVVHYSDRPRDGAEEIALPRDDRPSRPIIPSTRPAAAEPAAEAQPADDGYTSLVIASPGAEETLWNIGGTLNVTLNLQPALKVGHRVRIYFDGEPRMVAGTSFTIPEVYRGVHNIQAEVVTDTGELMIRSLTNRFYVQQTSILRPGATAGPR